MGRTPTRNNGALVVVVAVALFAHTSYSAGQSAPADNANNGTTSATSGSGTARIVIPPRPPGFPQSVPPATVSGNIPLAVPLPTQFNTPLEIRPNFDYFSWESFIALNWPAATGSRGAPDQPNNPSVFLNAGNGTPVVWGTYKDSFDLFGQGAQRPSPWGSSDSLVKPCTSSQAGQKTLIFITKGDTPLMQTKQAFSYPLVDQQKNYVYYEVRYDQAQYNFIRGQDKDPTSWLYLLRNLAPKENAQ